MVMGEFTQETDLLVIGAGPGGYAAAFRAADLGLDVMLVDMVAVQIRALIQDIMWRIR